MSEQLKLITSNASTSSWAASPAQTRATPDSARVCSALARAFGGRCGGSFATFDRDSFVWRTQQACIIEGSEKWRDPWFLCGMTLNGVAYRRKSAERLTVENGSLWLPTPTACDTKSSRRADYSKNMKMKAGTTLLDAVLLMDSSSTRGETSRRLNPRFVAWLMGIPIDWLAIDDGATRSDP